MMSHYLRGLAQKEFEGWQRRYEQRKTPEQIEEYQQNLRKKFIEAIGGLPERTALGGTCSVENPLSWALQGPDPFRKQGSVA